MCGTVATLGGDPSALDRAVAALRHRGPDGSGTLVVGDVLLGHTRLVVIDPTAASAQPFRYGDVRLSYNGELWNYRTLREELAALGTTFRTAGDTEVVAAALDAWGVDALPRLQGMFALA
jgi:asparagine synthase (glutamine-hydrolysing)